VAQLIRGLDPARVRDNLEGVRERIAAAAARASRAPADVEIVAATKYVPAGELGALADAGLTKDDVDGYFCAGDAPGLGGLSMADYMGLKLRHVDTTETGGSSYVIHVGHAAEAIAAGKCDVALITLAGRPRAEGMATGTAPRSYGAASPDVAFEYPYGPTVVNQYAMAAMRHMHEFGTTSAQLAWIKVAASQHAQHNPHALLREVVTVE
jgi:acetyl-CoA C-acetyltransferase